MKRSAYLINTSRGPVVDEDGAGRGRCREHLIAGAALDVYEREPIVHPDLLPLENVVLVPHLGSATTRDAHGDGRSRGRERARGARRQPPLTPVSRARGLRAARRPTCHRHDRTPAAGPRRAVMRTLARAIDGLELPAVEKISEEPAGGSVPGPDRDAALGAARRTRRRTPRRRGCSRRARTPRAMAKLSGEGDREADLPGELLPQQGRAREGGRAEHARRRGSAAWCRRRWRSCSTLPGVGRKTANLVLILAFQSRRQHLRRHARAPHLEPARVGEDRTPEETEQALYDVDRPRAGGRYINLYLVTWGQNVCRPVYPRCGDCAIADVCPRIGVGTAGGTNHDQPRASTARRTRT